MSDPLSPLSAVEYIQKRKIEIPRIPDATERGKITKEEGSSRPKFEVGKLYHILRGEVPDSFSGVGVFTGEEDVEIELSSTHRTRIHYWLFDYIVALDDKYSGMDRIEDGIAITQVGRVHECYPHGGWISPEITIWKAEIDRRESRKQEDREKKEQLWAEKFKNPIESIIL